MRRFGFCLVCCLVFALCEAQQRVMRYFPDGRDIVCVNGQNRYTRALYGSPTLFRFETSDRPVFATYDKENSRNIGFVLSLRDGSSVALDSTDFCEARYRGGRRTYRLRHHTWPEGAEMDINVMCCFDREAVVWRCRLNGFGHAARLTARSCRIADTKMKRGGDLGVDPREQFEPDPQRRNEQICACRLDTECFIYYANPDTLKILSLQEGRSLFKKTDDERVRRMGMVTFDTPDPFINTMGSVLMQAADGLWDGDSWLHGCIGWRTPLAGWRAAYVGDVVGWLDRSDRHFRNYAESMVTSVPPVVPHPTQDPDKGMARALKQWGTQMYSNGYICRSPNKNNVMHHYDMNLNFIDELTTHLQYHCDTAFIREFWPKMKLHLEWERRNFDPDNDHLYDAYCCIWASDALYYNSGAVTHSSAYNYKAYRMASRMAEIVGEDPAPYNREADLILDAMNRRLWLSEKGHWAEFQDFMGLKRLHESAALWSVYTPVDCGAGTSRQALLATAYVDSSIPHIPVDYRVDADALRLLGMENRAEEFLSDGYFTLSTTDWMPYVWSTNNVAHEEVASMALAYMQAGRPAMGFKLLKSDLLDEMFLGASPGNFGQISYYDAARKEAYRDFGDNVGITARALVNGLFGIVPQALYGQCVIQPAFPGTWNQAAVSTPCLSYRFHREGNEDVYEIEQHFQQPLRIIIRQSDGNGVWHETEGTDEGYQVIRMRHVERRDNDDWQKHCDDRRTVFTSDRLTEMGLDDVTPDASVRHHYVRLDSVFNAKVSEIFENEYRSPRSPYTTLEIPLHGMGDWCVPGLKAEISDAGLRGRIAPDGTFDTHVGVKFLSPRQGQNVVFTSLWDNYPDSVVIPAGGQASFAYLLMAGSTNNMQSRIDNGLVIAEYADHTSDTLRLMNPVNWCPVEQDYYYDEYAFWAPEKHPYRVHLGSGLTSRTLLKDLNIKGDGTATHTSDYTEANTPLAGGMDIPQGAAQLLKMPLNRRKTLRSLKLRTLSNDVVIGIMAITLED